MSELWKPSVNPWLVAMAVVVPTAMEVLDTSVANVALPHIAGTLSASYEEATWVLTSYLISNAIVLPASDWLGRLFGRKRFLMVCVGIFTLSSMLCGAATSLAMLVVARCLQGVGGGALQPLCQAVLQESFPPHKRGQAMAAYGMAIVVAPIIGPTLGGWLTDNFSWRWIFYVNLPMGLLALFMVSSFVEDPPYIKNQGTTRLDGMGLGLLVLWLATLQIVFDKGQLLDWFNSPFILGLSLVSAVAMVAFILWETWVARPLVNLRVLTDANCAGACFLGAMMGVVLFGSTALLPLFLQGQLHYSALQSGMAISPRGLGAIVGMVVIGRIINRFDPRHLILFGFSLLSASMFWQSQLSPDTGMINIILPNILGGTSMGFIFIPLSLALTASLPQDKIGAATGLYSLSRNLGGSVGISLAVSRISHGTQMHQTYLAAHMSPYDPAFQTLQAQLTGNLDHHVGTAVAQHLALAESAKMLLSQASLLSFVDAFWMMGALCLVVAPLVLFLRRPRARPKI